MLDFATFAYFVGRNETIFPQVRTGTGALPFAMEEDDDYPILDDDDGE